MIDLVSSIRWNPARYLLGTLLSATLLVAAPLIALIALAYDRLGADMLTVAKTLHSYLYAWALITWDIWVGVFRGNRWFGTSGESLKKEPSSQDKA